VLSNLFINTLLLVTFTFIIGHILKDVPINIVNSPYGKILFGLFGGLLGILQMFYSIQFNETSTLLDLRFFAVLIVSYLGGFMPTIIAGAFIACYRMLYFGVSFSSVIAVTQLIIIIICFFAIDKVCKSPVKKWIAKTLSALIFVIPSYYLLIHNLQNANAILMEFTAVVMIMSVLEFLLLEYVRNSNELYVRYRKDSSRDFLTGLYNTRHFDKMLNSTYEKVLENNEKISCLMIDIDHFKNVNDTYGHAVGDLVLKELAQILVKSCRAFDIIGRVGGEEFCILLLNCTRDSSMEVASRIRSVVKQQKIDIGEGRCINITVSIGVASYPDTLTNLSLLKEKADMALYNAKHSGRDKVCDNYGCINLNMI